jgi:hypothetical protein
MSAKKSLVAAFTTAALAFAAVTLATMALRSSDHPRHGRITETVNRVGVMYARRIVEVGT